jgi:glutaredoxin 3
VKAREAYAAQGREVDYRDVKADRSLLAEMLQHSGGRRDVPVILDGGKVTIGFGGS